MAVPREHLQTALTLSFNRLLTLDVLTSEGLQAVADELTFALGIVDAEQQRACRNQAYEDQREDSPVCSEDGLYTHVVSSISQLTKYIPIATIRKHSFLQSGFMGWDTRSASGIDELDFQVLKNLFHNPTAHNLVPMFRMRRDLEPVAAFLRLPEHSLKPVPHFFQWLGASRVPAPTDQRMMTPLKKIEDPSREPAPKVMIVGTFPTASEHLFQRDDKDDFEPSLTAEYANALFEGRPYASRVGFIDTNFFAKFRGSGESWNSVNSRELFRLGWETIEASGARVIVVTAGSNKERWAHFYYQNFRKDMSYFLGPMSATVQLSDGKDALLIFVLNPNDDDATKAERVMTIYEHFDALVRVLDALHAGSENILFRDTVPITESSLWPLVSELCSPSVRWLLAGAAFRSARVSAARKLEIIENLDNLPQPRRTWTYLGN